ncbi:MAG: acetate--CoA ligase family protein [Thermoleophilia bacterium]|nr:acetate--CoA ligase family protein [Thermoleophilia bacterium]
MRPAARELRALFEPGSVAVLGASADPFKWGHWLARGALKGAHRRPVYLVNRGGGEILGERALRTLADVPEPVELVVLAVPASGFEEAIDHALAAGAKAIVAISAGLGETGPEGVVRERAAVERVRAAGAVLLGPNCMGLLDAEAELDIGWNELPRGHVALVSQSGNVALELGLLLEGYGLGFSRFASLGNQADLEAAELVGALAEHGPTGVIALYLEDFRDGRAFAAAAGRATAAGKPVILLSAGRSEASARAARSHTGALVSELAAIDAACGAAGVLRVATPRELVDLAQALHAGLRPRGKRVGIVGDGGGHGVIAADVAAAHGLEVPSLSDPLAARIGEGLPARAATGNPVDMAGGEQDFRAYERLPRLVLESGEVDAVLLTGYFGGYGQDEQLAETELEVARAIPAIAAETARPLVVHTMYPDSPAAAALRAGGTPVYREIEAATGALARLAELAGSSAPGVPALPPPAEPPISADGYFEARALLAAGGVAFAPALPATTAAEARAAAAELGYPVALKALGLLHKSDAGGVVLGIGSATGLEHALADLAARLSPPGYSVERMAPVSGGVELIVGCRRDARFGPIALAGLGGVYAELLRDVAVALAPVEEETAVELLRSLRGAPLLLGARGRRPVDLRATARTLAAISRVAAERPEIAEIEVNPLLVTPDGALGLDARIVLAEAKGDDDAR